MLTTDISRDQAAGLRRMVSQKPVKVIAVTSGKGGVGKSSVSVNMAVAMAKQGKDVMLMDADLGLANVDVLLNMQPKYNLSHVMSGERRLEEVIVEGPEGIMVVPASNGVQHMSELSTRENAGLIQAFSELSVPIDTMIIDTAAGLHNSVVSFARAAREVVIVVCDEPASITDAYATIKVLSREHGVSRFHVIANMARSAQHGQELFNKLYRVTASFLDVGIDYMGAVPFDETLRTAVRKQRAVVDAYPRSKSALAFKKLVQKTENWSLPTRAEGHIEFFVERLIRYSTSEVSFG